MARNGDMAGSLDKHVWETPRLTRIEPERRLIELLLTANGYSADDARTLAAEIVKGRQDP